jgi:hypothetical protein
MRSSLLDEASLVDEINQKRKKLVSLLEKEGITFIFGVG